MDTHELSLQWADLGDEGFERVVQVESFQDAIDLLTRIQPVTREVGYEPLVTIDPQKVILHISEDPDGRHTELAHALDAVLG